VIFLQGESWAHRYQAATLSVTAAAYGEPVTVALFFDPLRRFTEGRLDEGAPEAAIGARVAPLAEMLAEARRDLGVRVVACETAVRLAGLDPAAVRPALDGLESLPELWRRARDGRLVVI
jgi:peroxiredoxin family protein